MDLVERLMEELRITREQAAGGAGLLLGFAQEKLGRDEFIEVAETIPAISDIIGKAPRCDMAAPHPLRARISRWLGGLGDLSALVKAFGGLGMDKAMIGQFVSVLLGYFRERGGEGIEAHLESVLR